MVSKDVLGVRKSIKTSVLTAIPCSIYKGLCPEVGKSIFCLPQFPF